MALGKLIFKIYSLLIKLYLVSLSSKYLNKVFAKTDGWENITIKDFLDAIEKNALTET